jgi:hypothetical protein
MSLNTVRLAPTQLTELYGKHLVETTNPLGPANPSLEEPTAAGGKIDLPCLGNNKKNVLVVVHYQQVVHLPDNELAFLLNLLSACNLGMEDVAVLNIQNAAGFSASFLLDHFNTKTVLLFGITPAEFGLPVSFPEFQVQQFNKAVFLYSPALAVIEPDKLLKSKLWVCLRRIFGL